MTRLVSTLRITCLSLLAGCGAATTATPVCPTPNASSASPEPSPAASAPPAGSSPEAMLVRDGIPAMPSGLGEQLRQYLNTRNAFLESVSDDGRSLLVTTRFANTAQLHVLRMPMGARTQLTFTEEPLSHGRFVPGSSSQLTYMKDRGGDEQTQIYRLDTVSGETRLLTDGQSRNLDYVWSDDGRKLAWSSNARNGRDMDVWISDGTTFTTAQRVLERTGAFSPVAFSHDGQKLLVLEFVSINDAKLHLVDLATREARQLTPPTPLASYRAAVFSRDDRTIYWTTDREGDFIELYEVDLASGQARPLTRDIHWNVEDLALSPDGRTLAFTTNEDGLSVLRLLDTRTRRARVVPNVPHGILSELHYARTANVLGFTFMSATTPGDIYTVDARGAVVRWTESEVGGLDRRTFVEPTLVHVRSFDGKEIPAFYYRPGAGGIGVANHRFPVVIDIHGGPEAQARPMFNPIRQYLVGREGYVVLQPNVRGSDGYGKSYLMLDDGAHREDSVRDIGALLDWIAQQPDLDPSRVAVYGGSYGGYMVLASLTMFGERLRAGVDVVGIANFVTFLENTSEYRRDLRRVEYGDERNPEMRALLTRISPVTNVDRIQSALFVAHGANDPRVPANEAEQIVRAVRARGLDVWYLLARNEGHGFQKKENRDAFNEAFVAFLRRNLAGDGPTRLAQ